jgi:hypothetical protein
VPKGAGIPLHIILDRLPNARDFVPDPPIGGRRQFLRSSMTLLSMDSQRIRNCNSNDQESALK